MVLDVGEVGRDGQAGVALPTFVMADGFGLAGDEGDGGFDKGGDASAEAAEGGLAWMDRMGVGKGG